LDKRCEQGGLTFAGIDPTGNLTVVEAYDIDKSSWSGPLTPKPAPASEVFAVSHGGKIYVPGSGAFGHSSAVFDVFERE